MPKRGAASVTPQDTTAFVLDRLQQICAAQVSVSGRLSPDLRAALRAAGVVPEQRPDPARRLVVVVHCLEDAAVSLPDLLRPGGELLIIEAQPWGSLHRLLRVLRPEAGDAAAAVAAVTGAGLARTDPPRSGRGRPGATDDLLDACRNGYAPLALPLRPGPEGLHGHSPTALFRGHR